MTLGANGLWLGTRIGTDGIVTQAKGVFVLAYDSMDNKPSIYGVL
jgi:hypothetical protein